MVEERSSEAQRPDAGRMTVRYASGVMRSLRSRLSPIQLIVCDKLK
jgi:hypothetical protein